MARGGAHNRNSTIPGDTYAEGATSSRGRSAWSIISLRPYASSPILLATSFMVSLGAHSSTWQGPRGAGGARPITYPYLQRPSSFWPLKATTDCRAKAITPQRAFPPLVRIFTPASPGAISLGWGPEPYLKIVAFRHSSTVFIKSRFEICRGPGLNSRAQPVESDAHRCLASTQWPTDAIPPI